MRDGQAESLRHEPGPGHNPGRNADCMALWSGRLSMSGEKLQSPILLVEDDLSLQGSLAEFLHDRGYRTIAASTLLDGRRLLASEDPWLCVLDLNLPDGCGLELLRQLSADGRRCRVIVMTAFGLAHQRPDNYAGVLAAWLDKPVDPDELVRLVEAERSRRACVRPVRSQGGIS
jgi:DNA-binding response OmpR family regulator